MADVIPSLQELEVINFGECLVRSKGAVAIAEAIKDGHPLLRVSKSHTPRCTVILPTIQNFKSKKSSMSTNRQSLLKHACLGLKIENFYFTCNIQYTYLLENHQMYSAISHVNVHVLLFFCRSYC